MIAVSVNAGMVLCAVFWETTCSSIWLNIKGNWQTVMET